MKVEVAYLQKNECYPCSRQEAKAAFGDLDLKWIGLGYPSRRFEFDSRCTHRPRVSGHIVASASYDPQREGWFSAYPVLKNEYPDEAKLDFRNHILPELRNWLTRQIRKPDTAVFGYEMIIVEWDGEAHTLHELAFQQ